MTPGSYTSEKTFQAWVHLRVTAPKLLVQELAKLKPESLQEFKFLNSLLHGHGLEELLQELQSEQELR